MGDIVRMMDHAGVRCGDKEDLIRWMRLWADHIESSIPARSAIIIIEDEEGQLGVISQSTDDLDTARVVGMMHMAASWKADGDAQIDDLIRDGDDDG